MSIFVFLRDGKTPYLNGRITIEMLLVRELTSQFAPIAISSLCLRDLIGKQTEIGNHFLTISQ